MKEKELSWHWGRYLIPSEWEVVKYGVHAEKGSMNFFSRKGDTATYSWRTVGGTPDFKRIQTEICRLKLHSHASKQLAPPTMTFEIWGSFQVGLCKEAELIICSQHFPKDKILLEWTFPYSGEATDIFRKLIESHRTNQNNLIFWSFQDFKVKLPQNYYLQEVNVLPGSSSAIFFTNRGEKIYLRRWAMPDELLGSRSLLDFNQWHARQLHRTVLESHSIEFNGMPAAKMIFKEKGKFGFESLLGKWWRGRAVVWRDNSLKRVFAFENYGPKGRQLPSVEECWI